MVNNSTNINKMNSYLSFQIIEHIKDHDIIMKLQIQVLAWGSHKIVVWLIPTLPFDNWMSNSNTDITKQFKKNAQICKSKRQIFNGQHKITNTQKTKDWATQTPLTIGNDMNSDASLESAVRTSLIPLHGRRSWEQLSSPLWKVEGGKPNFAPSPLVLERQLTSICSSSIIQMVYKELKWKI